MDQQQSRMLFSFLRGVEVASNHPFATCTIFGALAGSAVTYSVMNILSDEKKNGIFTPKVYRLELPKEDVHKLLLDPTTELRWETPEVSVVVSMEKPIPLKQLPDITVE